MRVTIVGCGYTGLELARQAVASGHVVAGTTTTPARLQQIARTGAAPVLMRGDDLSQLPSTLRGADAVVWLAPPPSDSSPREVAERISEALSPPAVLVYGSTTGVYGAQSSVDELSAVGEPSPRGRARLETELSLRLAHPSLRVVRIAGIYGPGRTLREGIESGRLVLFEGGPVMSRIHVEDLSRILLAMVGDDVPDLVIATDERPAPTLEVARYTAMLLGLELPPIWSREEATSKLPPSALELRLEGRRCVSLRRPGLIGALRHPTFVEGVVASLRE
ncbi:MAG: hypothetical protein HY791_20195 [Deltaproteobacteria bacterium]|nr:hypothetical protein [Deltaproteobacteria bacterium]